MPNRSIAKLRKLQAEAQALLEEKDVESHDRLSPSRKFAHFWVLVGKSFVRNRCPVRAAALAYTTLLALVPLLAVVVSVSTSFLKKDEGEQQIRKWIETATIKVAPSLGLKIAGNGESEAASETNRVPSTKGPVGRQTSEEIDKLVSQIMGFIRNFQSGTLGVTAILALVFVAISLLSTIEATLNDMWGVSEGRGWFARVVQYWAAITLGPLFLLVAVGLNTWKQFEDTQAFIQKVPFLGNLVFYFMPYLILSLASALFYRLMPNTKVYWVAALIGGLTAGTLLQLNSSLQFLYVSRVVTYRQIYGSLAILPLFLLGLYFSWLILLFGAQTAYAFQNRRAYIQEKQAEKINQRGREFVALRLMTYIGQRFQNGDRPPSAAGVSEDIGVPLRLACQILGVLVETKLLVEVAGAELGYAPARPLDSISAQDILQALRAGQGQELATCEDPVRDLVRQEFESIQQAERDVAAGLSLQNLVKRAKTVQMAPKASESLA